MLKVGRDIQNGHLPNSNTVTELSNLLGSDVSPCQYLVNATTVFLRRSVQNWCFPFFFSFKCGTGVQFLALATLSSSTRSCVPQSVMCVQHTTSSENRIFWRYVLGREWWLNSNKMQQLRLFFAMALLYMFRVTIPPIIRSTMLYMAFQVGRYTYVVILSIFW